MNMKVKYTTMIVKDMDESIKFYTDVMGFEVDSQYQPNPEVTITLIKNDSDAMIELIKDSIHDVGLYSIGIDVEDLDSTLKELKSKGAKITMEPVRTLVGRMAFAEDPNGVNLALIQHD